MTKEKIRELLLRYAAKRRWAFEELVYDERMKEANRLYSGPRREQKAYLSDRAVVWPTPILVADGLGELLYDEKEKEAVESFHSVRQMVRYLTGASCYGSRESLLRELKYLTSVQIERRKTWKISEPPPVTKGK